MTNRERRWLLRGGIMLIAVWVLVLASIQYQRNEAGANVPEIANITENDTTEVVLATPAPDESSVAAQPQENTPTEIIQNNDNGIDNTLVVANVPTEPIPGVAIVQFAADSDAAQRDAYLAEIGATIISEIAALHTVTIKLPDTVAYNTLPASSLLIAAMPDYYAGAAFTPNDPLYMSQWNLPVINAPAAWAVLPTTAAPVKIAVVDSGICAAHTELAGKIAADGWDFVENDANPQDDYGHGCAVTGVIAAQHNNRLGIAGVAPHAQILPVRVLDAQGIGSYSQVAAGIVYAVDHGAKIINISLGGNNPSSILENAIDYATRHDVLVVAATGNNGSAQLLYPAAYSEVVAVGSVDPNGTISSFSNYGAAVGLYAPGRDIATLALDGGYTTLSGTSLATPHVAAIAALEMAFGRHLTVNGKTVYFQLDDDDAGDGEITPVPLAECDSDIVSAAQENYFNLIQQGISGDALQQAGQAYLAAASECFALRYNNGTIMIDGGAIGSPNVEASAQFRSFGTKWGLPPAFDQNFPPAVSGGTITYTFLPNSVDISGAELPTAINPISSSVGNLPGNTSTCDLQERIRLAFDAWETVADIQFVEITEPQPPAPFNAPFDAAMADIRIGVHPIDGPSGQLGYAYFPSNLPTSDAAYETGTGDIFFDFGENWDCDTVFDNAGKIIALDLGLVALHEIGHAVGLGHEQTNKAIAVMNPAYSPNLPLTGNSGNFYLDLLQADDKNGARAIYGAPVGEIATPIIINISVNGSFPIVTYTPVTDADLYQIQITTAADTEFATIVRDTTTDSTTFTTNTPLTNGSYLVRVRAFNNGWGAWSDSDDFTINTGVPQPITPSNNEAVFNGVVTFGWNDEDAPSATEFEIEIATRAEFVDDNFLVIRTADIADDSVDITLTDAGTFFWRVRREGGDFSQPYRFTIVAERPENLNVVVDNGNEVTFNWSPVSGAVEYEFQLDSSENFVGLLFLDKLFLDKLFLDKLFLDKLFLDKLFLDKLESDDLFLDKLFLDKLFLDKLFLDKLFLDKLFLDKLFLDKLFLDKLFLDKLFLDKLFLDKLFLDKLTTTSVVGSLPVSEGDHYWRVRAVYADGVRGPWSDTAEFTIDTRNNNVVINEIKVHDPSWIELYNADNNAVDLTDWQLIVETANGEVSLVYTFPSGTIMQPNEYLVLYEADGTNTDTAQYLGSNTIDWNVTDTPQPAALANIKAAASVAVPDVNAIVGLTSDTVMNAPANDDEKVTAQATITVTTTSEVGPGCTLANAIDAANNDEASGDCPAGDGADVIELGNNENYVLTSELQNITSNITLNANGSTIQRDTFGDTPTFAIFTVTGTANFTLNDATLSDGAGGVGGNMHVGGTSIVTVTNSTIKNGNSTNGGGIFAGGNTTLLVKNSTIHNNTTFANDGGGLFLTGTATISNSTISNNSAAQYGGGIVTSATEFSTTNIINSTITQNSAGFSGAGFSNFAGQANVKNSIIANQIGGDNCTGEITDFGGNFANDNTCGGGFTNTATPLIENTLANNGGTTQTFALVSGSPAIDAATDCTDLSSNAIAIDQRGILRPQGGTCDAGAFELESVGEPPAVNMVVNDPDNTINGTDGLCSLSEAILAAHSGTPSGSELGECVPAAGINTITIDVPTITVSQNYGESSTGLPGISITLIIEGNGAIVQRNSENNFRLFRITTDGNLTLDNIKVRNGRLIGNDGGAIRNDGTLTLQNNSVVEDNTGDWGGGIFNTGTLNLIDSTVSDNTANEGGGIYNLGIMSILRSAISNNTAEFGGGIYIADPDSGGAALQTPDNTVRATDFSGYWTEIEDSLISGNSATNGGGIFADYEVAVIRSTVTNNTASNNGGGIYHSTYAIVLLQTSVVQNNTAGSNGGGIYSNSGYVDVVERSLISNNRANNNGGGIYAVSFETTINNSTVADNEAGSNGGGLYIGTSLFITRSAIIRNQASNNAGGIYVNINPAAEESAEINNTTISGNDALENGDGIYTDDSLFISNTTIAFHEGTGLYATNGFINISGSLFANSGENCVTISYFNLNVNSDSLATDATCSDATIGDPMLGALTGNPAYHPLETGSDAIDNAVGEFVCHDIDQRGVARPQGAECDSGSIESTQANAPVPVVGTVGGTVRLVQNSTIVELVRFGDTTAPVTNDFTGGNIALPENEDETIGRDPYSSDTNHVSDWARQAPTLGGQNFVRLKINEINTGTTDYIEIVNPGFDTVDMTGWQLITFDGNGFQEIVYTFPNGFSIAPITYVVVYEGAGSNTDTKLYMNQSISWSDFNAKGAVSLTNGGFGVDFVRFGDGGANALAIGDVQPKEGTKFIGLGAVSPLPSQSLGRDSLSNDTDTGKDWTTQTPSGNKVNPVDPTPANDDFINAIVIDSLPYQNKQSTLEGTVNNNEPVPACGVGVGRTVWYVYTATSNENIRIQTDGTDFDTVLAVWTYNGINFTAVDCDNDSGESTRSRLDIAATSGTTYYIQVGGQVNDGGALVLSVQPPDNDDFDDALPVTSAPYSNTQQTLAATLLAEDPIPSCVSSYNRTVWYEFTPTSNDTIRFTTEDSDYDTGIAVYTGTRDSLTEVACNDDEGQDETSSLLFTPVAGTTYYVMVSGSQDKSGTMVFEVQNITTPVNDELDGVINFTLTNDTPQFTYEENTDGATNSNDEPVHSCGLSDDKSVWFSYTPSIDGIVVLQSINANYDTVMSVYEGQPNGSSSDIACNDDVDANQTLLNNISAAVGVGSRIILDANIGTTYYIQISGRLGASGNLFFEAFIPDVTPPNDEITGAFDVTSLPYEFEQTTTGATLSPNDESLLPFCGSDLGKTVWYTYTPTDGNAYLEFSTDGSTFDTVMAIYKEIDGNLVEIACDDDSGDGTRSLIQTTTGDTTPLFITIGGYQGDSGNLKLNVSALNRPPTIENPGNQAGLAGQPIAPLPIIADDEDNDTLEFSAAGLPPGLEIDPVTGVISGVPGGAFANTLFANADLPVLYTVVVSVNDGNGGIARTRFNWSLSQPNQTIAVTSFTLVNAENGTDIMAITDGMIIFDGDLPTTQLSVRANTSGSPESVRFALNGNLNFNTDNAAPFALAGQTGSDYNAWAYVLGQENLLTATPFTQDNAGGLTGTSLSVSFTIAETPNQAPTVINPGNQTNTSGNVINLPIVASDPENQTLTYSATGLPSGLSINPNTGVISGTLAANAQTSSPYTVTVTVKDPGNLSDSETFTWTVKPLCVPDPLAHLTAQIVPGATAGKWVGVITNNSDCKYDVGMAAYQKMDNTLKNQVLFTPNGTATALQIGRGETRLTVTAPQCAAQLDIFFDASHLGVYSAYTGQQAQLDIVPLILPAFETNQFGTYGNRYNARLLLARHLPGDFCGDDEEEEPTPNLAPTVNNPGNQTNTSGNAIALPIVANDPEGLALTYSATGLPSGLSINPNTGVINGTLASNAHTNSPYTVTVTVKDPGNLSDSETFTWIVNAPAPVNQPPTVTNPGNQTNTSSDVINLPIVANDPENQTLIYSATGLPSGLSINPNMGVISGTLASNAHTNSPYTITVTVKDPGNLSDSETFTWMVNAPAPVNQAPTINNPGNQTNTNGQSVNLLITGNDPENKPLRFSATGLPAGLSIDDASGVISGILASNAHTSSPYTVTITVLDDGGLTDSKQFSWIVNAPTPVNQAPTINNPGNQTNTSGQLVNLLITGNDPENKPLRFSATGLPAGLSIDDASGVISGILASNAHTSSPYTIIITVLDDGGLTDSKQFSWIVNEPAPVVLCSQLDPLAHLTAQIVPGDVAGKWVGIITNNSDCLYDVGVAAYKKLDAVQKNQELFSSATALQVGRGETRLTMDAPQCATQLDVFFDASHLSIYPAYAGKQAQLDVVPMVVPTFATNLYGIYGNWYGPRLLKFQHIYGQFCTPDTDSDKVVDTFDLCPQTPAGAIVDATGCAASQLDGDNDGIHDALDTCPQTLVGDTVDATGCTVTPIEPVTSQAQNSVPAGDAAAAQSTGTTPPVENTDTTIPADAPAAVESAASGS